MTKIILTLLLLQFLFPLLFADEIILLNKNHGKGKIFEVTDKYVSFQKIGLDEPVDISIDDIDYITYDDGRKIVFQHIKPVVDSIQIRQKIVSDSISEYNNRIKFDQDSSANEIKYRKFYSEVRSPFISYMMTFPLLPIGHIYNEEPRSALVLFGLQTLCLTGLIVGGLNDDNNLFATSGLFFTGVFAFSKYDACKSAERFNLRLTKRTGFLLPNDYYKEEYSTLLFLGVFTFLF